MISLKAFMALTIRFIFLAEISPTVKESSPKRIGTRTIELFINFGGCCSTSTTFAMRTLTALEPMSMAAYFFISI